jgi:tripartite-type tricarboxylate transporter receptor subunit TctC
MLTVSLARTKGFGAAALGALLATTPAALAQSNPLPTGRMTMMIGFAAGGPLDIVSRLLAEKLGPRIDRTIVLENRAGAGGNVAAIAVAKSDADGLTVLTALDTVFTVAPHLFKAPGFRNEEFSPLALIGLTEQLLAVNVALPVASLSDLVAYSKSNTLAFASGGNGTSGHLAFEAVKLTTGLRASHVPYRGAAPAANDLIAGHVQIAFIVSSALLPHVRAGKLKALAVSSPTRLASLPDVPTAKEAGVRDFEAQFAFVAQVPVATPAPVQDYLSREITAVFALPDVREKLSSIGVTPRTSTRDEARTWISREGERWRKVIEATGMKVE